MATATLILTGRDTRERAKRWIDQAPSRTVVTFRGVKRTIPQNDLMWAALTDVSRQVEWHGVRLSPEDWKLLFLAALKQEMRLVPNLDGNGFVNLGRSSSSLSKEEMSDLIEIIFKFGAEHEVVFKETSREVA